MPSFVKPLFLATLCISVAACATDDAKYAGLQPFPEGPWGATVKPTPPPPAPIPLASLPPEAEPAPARGFFNRDPEPDPISELAVATELDAAPEPEPTRGFFSREPEPQLIASAPEPANAPAEPKRKFSLFKRKPKPDPVPDSAPEIETGVEAEASAPVEDRPTPPPTPATNTVSFVNDIKPIFEGKCVTCHNTDTLTGRMSLESHDLAFKPGPGGPFIIPGDPEASLLFQKIVTSKSREDAMPPVGHRLTRKEKNLIFTWINEGADWPRGKEGRVVPDLIVAE